MTSPKAPEQDRRDPGQKRLARSLLLIVPIAALATAAYTFSTTDGSAWTSLRPPDLGTALFAAALTMVPWFTDAGRMAVWSRFLGAPVPYGHLLRLSAFAELGAAVTPPALGTAPVKIALLLRHGISGGAALTITTLSSLEDWLFFLITVPLCLAAAPAGILPGLGRAFSSAGSALFWLVAATVVIGLLVYLRRSKDQAAGTAAKVGGLWDRLLQALREFGESYRLVMQKGKTRFLLTMVLTAVQWGCRYSVVTVLVRSMGLPADPVQFFALQAVIFALSSVVPTPGGAGGMEALFMVLYRPLLPDSAIGIATAFWRVSTFYLPVLLASVVAVTPFAAGRDRREATSGDRRSLSQPQM